MVCTNYSSCIGLRYRLLRHRTVELYSSTEFEPPLDRAFSRQDRMRRDVKMQSEAQYQGNSNGPLLYHEPLKINYACAVLLYLS